MPTEHDVTLKSADCLAKQLEFGATKIHNICTGAISEVPWGSMDYAGAILFGIFISGITILFVGMAVSILFMMRY